MRVRSLLLLSLSVASLAACASTDDDAASSESAVATSPLGAVSRFDIKDAGPSFARPSGVVSASNGKTFVVAWGAAGSVHVARVSADGAVLDDRSLLIPGSTDGDESPALASNGDGYLLAWTHRTKDGTLIDVARLDANAKLVDATPIALGQAAPRDKLRADGAAIAWDGRDYVLGYSDERIVKTAAGADDALKRHVFGARIGTDGKQKGADFQISSGAFTWAGNVSLAAAGDTILAAWQAEDPAQGNIPVIRGARLGPTGPIDAESFEITGQGVTAGTNGYDEAPRVASNGTDFLVAFQKRVPSSSSTSLRAVRLTKTDRPVEVRDLATSASLPEVVWDGDSYVIVWEGGGRRIGADGTIGATLPAETTTSESAPTNDDRSVPTAASNGKSLLVLRLPFATTLDGSRDRRLVGSLFPRGQAAATKTGIFVAREDAAQGQLSAAFNGTRYLAAWVDFTRPDRERGDIRVAFFGVNGAPTAAPVTLRPDQPVTNLSVRADETGFRIGWRETADAAELTVAHVKADGSVDAGLTKAANLDDAPKDATHPNARAIWDGTSFVSAWIDATHLFVSRKGATPIDLGSIGGATTFAASGNGKGTIALAWSDREKDHYVVRGARVSAALDAPVATLVALADRDLTEPHLTHALKDGTAWQLTFNARTETGLVRATKLALLDEKSFKASAAIDVRTSTQDYYEATDPMLGLAVVPGANPSALVLSTVPTSGHARIEIQAFDPNLLTPGTSTTPPPTTSSPDDSASSEVTPPDESSERPAGSRTSKSKIPGSGASTPSAPIPATQSATAPQACEMSRSRASSFPWWPALLGLALVLRRRRR